MLTVKHGWCSYVSLLAKILIQRKRQATLEDYMYIRQSQKSRVTYKYPLYFRLDRRFAVCKPICGKFKNNDTAVWWILQSKMKKQITRENIIQKLFQGRCPQHIKTSPLISSANQCTGFYNIGTSVRKTNNKEEQDKGVFRTTSNI